MWQDSNLAFFLKSRNFLYSKRKLLKELQDWVLYKVINYWYNKKKGLNFEGKIISVLHTFGEDLKSNTYGHALVIEGGVDKKFKWEKLINYIP